VFWGLIGVFSLVTYALIAKKYGIHLNHLSLTAESPNARQQFNNSVSGYSSGTGRGALVAYLINWQSNVINPLLILLGAYRRRLSFALLGVLGQVVLFSITDFRATIASVPFVLAIGWLVAPKNRSRGANLFAKGALVITGLSWVILMVSRSAGLEAMTRLGVNNGVTTGTYYDFFLNHPFAHWSSSFLRLFVSNPYPAPYESIISDKYTISPGGFWNGNMWADGFANWGFRGMLIAVVILAAFLWLYDSVTHDLDLALSSGLIAVPVAVGLANTPVQNSLLTGGLILSLVLAAVVPPSIIREEKRERTGLVIDLSSGLRLLGRGGSSAPSRPPFEGQEPEETQQREPESRQPDSSQRVSGGSEEAAVGLAHDLVPHERSEPVSEVGQDLDEPVLISSFDAYARHNVELHLHARVRTSVGNAAEVCAVYESAVDVVDRDTWRRLKRRRRLVVSHVQGVLLVPVVKVLELRERRAASWSVVRLQRLDECLRIWPQGIDLGEAASRRRLPSRSTRFVALVERVAALEDGERDVGVSGIRTVGDGQSENEVVESAPVTVDAVTHDGGNSGGDGSLDLDVEVFARSLRLGIADKGYRLTLDEGGEYGFELIKVCFCPVEPGPHTSQSAHRGKGESTGVDVSSEDRRDQLFNEAPVTSSLAPTDDASGGLEEDP
jgi:hypothetical protein